MRTRELERLAARHVPGEGTVDIRPMSRGLVNETYRVRRDGNAYALRVASRTAGGFGLDATFEARVLERAAAAGLAPVPLFCDPERRILISRWVEGGSWNAADARTAQNICRMSSLVRRVHALPVPAPGRPMSPAQWIARYSAAAQSGSPARSGAAGARASRLAEALRESAAMRLNELAALPGVDPVLCHSDLHTLNLMDRGDSLVLLDWEYAHVADPFWDLAGWSANNDFAEGLRNELLAAYSGRPPTSSERQRLELECWLYDYVCWLWCELASRRAAARAGVAARGRELGVRLRATASGRAPQVPAHYPGDEPAGDINGEQNGADDRGGPGWKGA